MFEKAEVTWSNTCRRQVSFENMISRLSQLTTGRHGKRKSRFHKIVKRENQRFCEIENLETQTQKLLALLSKAFDTYSFKGLIKKLGTRRTDAIYVTVSAGQCQGTQRCWFENDGQYGVENSKKVKLVFLFRCAKKRTTLFRKPFQKIVVLRSERADLLVYFRLRLFGVMLLENAGITENAGIVV